MDLPFVLWEHRVHKKSDRSGKSEYHSYVFDGGSYLCLGSEGKIAFVKLYSLCVDEKEDDAQNKRTEIRIGMDRIQKHTNIVACGLRQR